VAEKEFFSFDEALKELRLKEEELRRLVSEGEIRAFREGDTMKLRRSDVENLRSELSGGEVVDLGGAGEELVFEDDTDVDAGMATEEISEIDTLLEEVEEVGELELEEIEDELEEADELEDERSARRAAAVAVEVEEPSEPMWLRAVTILTGVVLLMATPVLFSAATGNVSGLARSIAGMFGLQP
jgi:excisionase family DNA binding protein